MVDFQDAFNDCIDRLHAGEALESCLRDYPDHAERLRQYLAIGQLVERAHYSSAEVRAEQERLRTTLLSSPRKAPTGRTSGWLVGLGAVAALVFVAAGVMALLSPSVGNIFSNLVRDINVPPAAVVGVTAISGVATVGGSAVAMIEGTPTPDELALTTLAAQQTSLHLAGTATPSPTGTTTITPSSTPGIGGITQVSTVTPTVTVTTTPTGTPLPSMTAPATTTAPRPTSPVHDTVATSVVLMTPEPFGTTIFGDVSLTGTAVALNIPPIIALTATPFSSTQVPMGATMPPLQLTPTPIDVIPLSAGEIDDNANWDRYLQYRRNYLAQFPGTVHDVDVSRRQIIQVVSSEGLPVLGARVERFLGGSLVDAGETTATGEVLFFPDGQEQPYRMVVTHRQESFEFILDPRRGSLWTVQLPYAVPVPEPPRLDVVFLLDATGSMGDEIAQLQNNLLAISSEIDRLGLDVRYGLVHYRDRGDAYVVQQYDFVTSVADFQVRLNAVQADGGGDTPESLNEALWVTVNQMSWRSENTVKLIFLVADAAPHLDYANDTSYSVSMAIAARQGIKIHPIASSGLTQDGEFILRQIAQYTQGHFIFLTYQQPNAPVDADPSRPELNVGTPEDIAAGQQGDYTVEQLDELVMRLIRDEFTALRTPVANRGGVVAELNQDVFQPTLTATFPLTLDQSPTALPPPTQSSLLPGSSQRLAVSVPVLLGLIGGGLTLGLLLRTRTNKLVTKRKRSEVIDEWW